MNDLWAHQRKGVERIRSARATLLHWDMRTGKSRAIVEYVVQAKPRRTLILCPHGVIEVWPNEFYKFAKTQIICVAPTKGTVATRLKFVLQTFLIEKVLSQRPIVVVVNHESAWRTPMGQAFLKVPWDLIVIDESHRGKAPGGKFSRWTSRLADAVPQAKRVSLTGTPMPHSPLDIYAQYRFLDKSIFGKSNTAFKARYAIMGGHTVNGRPVQVLGFQHQEELRDKVNQISDRVRIHDVLDMPEEVHEVRYVDLPSDARKVYNELDALFISWLGYQIENDIPITAANAMVKVGKLQQIASGSVKDERGVARSIHDVKTQALVDLLGDLPPDEPVVVFCKYHASLDAVLGLDGQRIRVCELSGRINEVGAKWQPEMLSDDWDEQSAARPLAAIQIQAGSVGIDLAAASIVVWYDQTFSLGDYEQARARFLGVNQKAPTVLHVHLLARDTVDLKIRRALATRRRVIDMIMEEAR